MAAEAAGTILYCQRGSAYKFVGWRTCGILNYNRAVTSRIEIVVGEQENRKRLEDFLFDRFGGLSRMYLRDVVKKEKCEVNGRLENIGHRLRPNDFIEIELDLTRETSMRPQAIDISIIFEDDQLIVVDKPAGMLVHPTNRDKSGTLLNALSYHLNREKLHLHNKGEPNGNEYLIRPGLVHRLDRQTSGIMVIAKTPRAHRLISKQFQKKLVEKRYIARVEGRIEADEGTIDAPVARFAELKQWKVKDGGKPAQTRFWVLQRSADSTLVELEPVTGRTNQLRIHCEHIGHPIFGDTLRGGRELERLCLHAYKLTVRHPQSGEDRTFESPIPDLFFAGLEQTSQCAADGRII